jgi:hypothetical protein
MIAMIGCGYKHPVKKIWVPITWEAQHLTMKYEEELINTWIHYMTEVVNQYDHLWSKDKRVVNVNKKSNAGGRRKIKDNDNSSGNSTSSSTTAASSQDQKKKFKCFNWSKAEQNFLEQNYNSAAQRHGKENEWKDKVYWADLHQLCKEEELAIRGCFNYSLKSVVKSLNKLGKISDVWISSPVENGMSAMMALLRCEEDAIKNGREMQNSLWMSELRPYLLVDIHSVYSLVDYFRKHHL